MAYSKSHFTGYCSILSAILFLVCTWRHGGHDGGTYIKNLNNSYCIWRFHSGMKSATGRTKTKNRTNAFFPPWSPSLKFKIPAISRLSSILKPNFACKHELNASFNLDRNSIRIHCKLPLSKAIGNIYTLAKRETDSTQTGLVDDTEHLNQNFVFKRKLIRLLEKLIDPFPNKKLHLYKKSIWGLKLSSRLTGIAPWPLS